MHKILVTGVNGFIGSYTYSYFKNLGYSVTGITVDIRNKSELRPFFPNIDVVIHTAGKVTKGIPNPEVYYSTNVLGTRNICLLCLETGAKLIHLGSAASAAGGDHTVKLYVESKQESQKLVERYAKLYGLQAVVYKLGVVYDTTNNTGRSGARYPIERLLSDFEATITTHNFANYSMLDYSSIRA